MALRINLYHEVLRAKRQEQYDPLKLSMLGLIVVAAVMAVYYFVQLKRTSDARSAMATTKAEFDRVNPEAKEAEKKEGILTKQIDLADKLAKRMEGRVYWAPLLETVMAAVPPNVQLTKLGCDSGRAKGGACQMNIEGMAADQEPRAVAEDLRKAIGERISVKYPSAVAIFRNLDDSAAPVTVNGKAVAAVLFTINVTFKTEAEPAPAAVPPKRIAKNESVTP